MKTSIIIALVGVIGLVAFAGTIVAAGSLPVGTAANGSGAAGMGNMGGIGGMHGGMHQNGYQYQYYQSSSGCPMGQSNNYTWDNDYGGCGCSGRW